MRMNPGKHKEPADKVVKDIDRRTRRHHSAEEKIRIVLEGLRGEDSIAEEDWNLDTIRPGSPCWRRGSPRTGQGSMLNPNVKCRPPHTSGRIMSIRALDGPSSVPLSVRIIAPTAVAVRSLPAEPVSN